MEEGFNDGFKPVQFDSIVDTSNEFQTPELRQRKTSTRTDDNNSYVFQLFKNYIPFGDEMITKTTNIITKNNDAMNEYKRENKEKKYWRQCQLFCLFIIFIGCSYLLYIYSSPSSSSLTTYTSTINDTYDIWEDMTIQSQFTRLITPPFSNVSFFANISKPLCNSMHTIIFSEKTYKNDPSNNQLVWSETDIHQLFMYQLDVLGIHSYIQHLYYNGNEGQRSSSYVSLGLLIQKMIRDISIMETMPDYLCTFMFGNWSKIFHRLPCFCITKKLQGVASFVSPPILFNPMISNESNEKIKAKTKDFFWITQIDESNNLPITTTTIRELPKVMELIYDSLSIPSSFPISTKIDSHYKSQKSLDRRTNTERIFLPIPKDHNKLTLLHPFDVYTFKIIQAIYLIHTTQN